MVTTEWAISDDRIIACSMIDLRLLVELGAYAWPGRSPAAALLQQGVEVLVAPFGAVAATDGGTAEVVGEEVVRIAIVAGPADDHGTVAVDAACWSFRYSAQSTE